MQGKLIIACVLLVWADLILARPDLDPTRKFAADPSPTRPYIFLTRSTSTGSYM